MTIQRSLNPVSPDALRQVAASLSKNYGSEVYDVDGDKVLCIRVPNDDPDPVNDVDRAIDHLEVQEFTHVLLVGNKTSAQIYAEPVQDKLRQRQVLDAELLQVSRTRLEAGRHMLFQAPRDRKAWRLAAWFDCDTLAEIEDEHINELADALGPQLGTPRFQNLVAAYVMSNQDEARLSGDVFVLDLKRRYEDEERRLMAARVAERKAEAERARVIEHHRKLIADIEQRVQPEASATEIETSITARPRVAPARSAVRSDVNVTQTRASPAASPAPEPVSPHLDAPSARSLSARARDMLNNALGRAPELVADLPEAPAVPSEEGPAPRPSRAPVVSRPAYDSVGTIAHVPFDDAPGLPSSAANLPFNVGDRHSMDAAHVPEASHSMGRDVSEPVAMPEVVHDAPESANDAPAHDVSSKVDDLLRRIGI